MFEGKRVLVTGADGFIGSHLVEALVHAGASVRGLAQYNSFNDWGWLEQIDCLQSVEVVTGDIRDPHFCLELTGGIEVVFHLAALIAIPFSYRCPDSYIDTNIRGTANLCHAGLRNRVARFVQTSTSEVYGTAEYVPIDERHPLKPQSPYSASKVGADAIAMSFWHSFSLPVVVARPFNTFGPRQSARAVIPTIITQLLAGKRDIALGDLRPTRDFTFVADTCRGLMAVASLEDHQGEVFNIGSGKEISIGELFDEISLLAGGGASVMQDEGRLRPATSEVLRLLCDTTKLRQATGFAPAVSLREGLHRTLDWFRQPDNLRRYKQTIYNV